MHIPTKVVQYLHFLHGSVRRFSTFYLLRLWLCLVGLAATGVEAAPPQRVAHSRPDAVSQLTPLGPLASTNRLNLAISLPLRNQDALAQLLQQLYDPHSPQFHHYLTPGEFAEQFGPSEADYESVIRFARANGLQVTTTHSNRLLVDVGGAVPDIEKALHVKFHSYQHPTEHRTFYAPDSDPTLDLATPVLQISGLDNFARPRPHFVAHPLTASAEAKPNAGSGPSGTYSGYDFRAAYVPDTTLTGAGQSVGLLQFDGYTPADISYYLNQAGLPAVPLQNVLLDGFNGQPTYTGGEGEVSLDIEMANSMAPGLSQIIVYMAGPGGNWHDILNRMATDDLANQLSCSWYIQSGTADPTADAIFQQMASQGQSFLNASGDNDAYSGLISFPGDSPYITQVGGTTLATTGPHGAYVSEAAWNRGNGTGTGGGISTQYPIPTWQNNISMTRNQGSTTRRNTPDVALTAENIYVRVDGSDNYVGGTSCAAPLWAGFAALVNQQAAASGRSPAGFLNPALAAIGNGATYAQDFHDITVGNNESSASPTQFSAVPGYDLCTGWGTPAGQNLINDLADPEPLLITPQTGFTSAGRVGGPFTVTTQTLTLTNSGTDTLTWSLSSTSAWINVFPTSGNLTPGGTAAVVTARLTAAASNLVVGAYSTTVLFTNLSDLVGQGRIFNLSVITLPRITAQPTNLTLLEGQNAAFSVTATGGQPLAYQWLDNGAEITNNANGSGATTANLFLDEIASAQAGTYQVVITNAAGAVTSAPAILTIPLSVPIFALQPTNETLYQGQTAEFAVAVVGTEPYSYQWTFNNQNLAGATNAVLTLADLQLTQSGNYAVVVSNSQGSTTSATAVLTVNPPPPCAPISAGMVAWWAGEGNANDSVGVNNGTLMGGASYAAGEVDQAFLFDGVSGYVSIPDSPSLDVFVTNITIELWLQVNQTTPNADWRGIVTKGNTSWRLQGTSQAGTINFAANGVSTDLSGTRNINDGQWHHVAAVYDSTNIYLYVDGKLDASTPATGSIIQNSFPVCLGENPDAPLPYYFNGLEDEVSLYNRALSANEIELIYLTGAGGKCPVPITINTQPTNETAYAGANVTFVAAATGSQPLTFQWYDNGNAIGGATSNVFTLEDIQTTDAGIYTLTVANANGSVTSSNAVLTVLTTPPYITVQPANETNYAGGTVTFNVTAEGTPPLSYQWDFNSVPISGANSSALTLTDLQPSQAGVYSVEVSNPYGSTNSSDAMLTVNAAPPCATIAIGMADWWQGEGNANDSEGVNNGTLVGGVSFIPGEVGQAFLFDGSSGYVSIPDSPSLDTFVTNITIELWIQVNQTTPNSDWRGIVTKGNTSWRLQGTSQANTIYFAANGLSNDLKGNQNVNDGQWHHVAAVYDGTNIYLYVDGSLDASTPATGSIIQNSFPVCLGANPDAPQLYYFNGAEDEVTLYNRALSAQEIRTIYQVGSAGKCPVQLAFYLQPTNQAVQAGDDVSLVSGATGIQPLTYQWTLDGTDIDGATNAVLTLDGVAPSDAGIYAVTASDANGSITSSNALLTVDVLLPYITTQPENQTNGVGGSVTFSVTAGGSQPLSYQWSFDLFNIDGATNATLTLTNLQLAQTGTYAVQVSNPYGITNSIPAALVVNPLPTCAAVSSNMVSWWAAEGNANDSVGTNNGTLVGGVSYAPGEVGQAFLLDGSSGYVSIPDSASLDAIVTNITIELWLLVNQTTPNSDWSGIVTKGNNSWRLQGTPQAGTIYFAANGLSTDLQGNQNVNDGQWHHVAAVYDGTNIYLYVDGSLDASTPATGSIIQDSYPVALGANLDSPQPYYFNGLLDEVSIYNRALSAAEIKLIYSLGSAGKCLVPLTILSQPTNETVTAGAPVTFTVGATGEQPVTYQWNFNGINLPGATNSWLTVTSVQPVNAGNYAVTVENPYNYITSSNALLTVLTQPPTIRSQPIGQTNYEGTTVSFSVSAGGSLPLSYQWSANSTNLIGATNATLTLANVQPRQAGNYLVVITNNYGVTNSAAALLTVIIPNTNVPVIKAFSPMIGTIGNQVTIAGTNFSPTPLNNAVYFGAVRASVTQASTNSLIVSVPVGAIYAPITVTVGGLTAYSPTPFLVTYPGGAAFSSSTLAGQFNLVTASGPAAVVIADFDGDGKPDLAVNSTAGVISVFRNISTNGNLSSASFAPRVDFKLGANALYAMVAADIDGDGKLDLVALNNSANQVMVLRNLTSPGSITTNSFAAPINFAAGLNPRGLAVRDLDGDGKPDITVANWNSSTVSVLRNTSNPGSITTASFAPAVSFSVGSLPQDVRISDIDGDGKADIVTVNNGNSTTAVSVLRNQSTLGIISFANTVNFAGLTGSYAIAIGDIDGDGKPDVVIGSQSGNDISIFRNTSTPGTITTSSLAAHVDFAASGYVNSIALGDISGSGKPDVAQGTQVSNHLSLFKNNSTPGTFTSSSLGTRVDFASGLNVNGVAVGDLDGDGQPDIVCANTSSGTLSIYHNIVPSQPFITAQPLGSTNYPLATVTFNVTAAGTSPLYYQWELNGAKIAGATNTSLVLTNLQVEQSGNYSVLVTNINGSAVSSNATLVVTPLYHFVWNQIPSPRYAKSAFNVVIQAQNLTNGVATNFSSTVALASTNGIAVVPAASGNFIQGIWTGTVTVAQTATNLVLQATDTAGDYGLANPVNIVSLPALTSVTSGSSLLLYWPTSPTGFSLQTTPSLAPAKWVNVNSTPFQIGNQYLLPVPLTGSNAYYRLLFPGP